MKLNLQGEEWRDFHVENNENPQLDSQIIAEAKKNIENLRKSQIEITILDESGKILPQFEVNIIQKSHHFLFGDQLWTLDTLHRFNQWNTDKALYFKERFKEVFNAANALCYWTEAPRNDGPKIEDFQGRNITEHFEACVDWAKSQNLLVKGHPLFWSIPKCVPQWLLKYDYNTRMKFAEVRVRNLVSRFSHQIKIWDAVNEALWEPVFKNLDNRYWPHIEKISDIADMIQEVLSWCKNESPDAKFLINDYGLEDDSASGCPETLDGIKISAAFQRQRYVQLIRELKQRGFAPDAIGLQSHSGTGWVPIHKQKAVFDEISTANLPIHVTEFWAHTDHLKDKYPQEQIDQLQADYVKNILTLAFGHPAVEAFFFWGFIDDSIEWKNYSSHTVKPMFNSVKKLIHVEWNSSVKTITNDDGKISFKGFHGKYSLQLNKGKLCKGYEFNIMSEKLAPEQKIQIKLN